MITTTFGSSTEPETDKEAHLFHLMHQLIYDSSAFEASFAKELAVLVQVCKPSGLLDGLY